VRAAALWGADSFCFNSGAGANRSPRRNTCSLVDQDLSLFNPCDKRLPRPSCCIFTTRVNTHPVALALPNEFLMLRLVLLILIIMMLLGSLPTWPYSTGWGYYPSGGLGTVLLILIILIVLRVL
jgi:hypothetical protein